MSNTPVTIAFDMSKILGKIDLPEKVKEMLESGSFHLAPAIQYDSENNPKIIELSLVSCVGAGKQPRQR